MSAQICEYFHLIHILGLQWYEIFSLIFLRRIQARVIIEIFFCRNKKRRRKLVGRNGKKRKSIEINQIHLHPALRVKKKKNAKGRGPDRGELI